MRRQLSGHRHGLSEGGLEQPALAAAAALFQAPSAPCNAPSRPSIVQRLVRDLDGVSVPLGESKDDELFLSKSLHDVTLPHDCKHFVLSMTFPGPRRSPSQRWYISWEWSVKTVLM